MTFLSGLTIKLWSLFYFFFSSLHNPKYV